MAVFRIPENEIWFPAPEIADENGLLGVGGNLNPDTLLHAYSNGIFPWFGEGEPILWWSPDPRLMLFCEDLRVSKSMRKILKDQKFRISFDTAFEQVIRNCSAQIRPGQEGTWITKEMMDAYTRLHLSGFAHSAEAWLGNDLVGGLYGVSLGNAFFGESMFSKKSNASKAAFITLVETLREKGFNWIDCQVPTEHLISLGAKEIPRGEFLELLSTAMYFPTLRGSWSEWKPYQFSDGSSG